MSTLSSMPEEPKTQSPSFSELIEQINRWSYDKYSDRVDELLAPINQQIKSVLNELEKSLIHIDEHICRFNDGEQTCDCYKEADDITRAAIQKIRSRYE